MKFYEALGAVIREERYARKMTLRDVARKGYVSMGHLSDVENSRKEGSETFIEAVANALGMPAYELIIEAGYRMAESKVPDTLEEILKEDSPILQ
jgi:transcriptional regulator with XRE-family HTH domain